MNPCDYIIYAKEQVYDNDCVYINHIYTYIYTCYDCTIYYMYYIIMYTIYMCVIDSGCVIDSDYICTL